MAKNGGGKICAIVVVWLFCFVFFTIVVGKFKHLNQLIIKNHLAIYDGLINIKQFFGPSFCTEMYIYSFNLSIHMKLIELRH